MPEFTTQDYAQLSQNAYDISSSKDYTQCGGSYRLEKNRYFVLDRKNNPVNGFQGMIVAPAMKQDGKLVPDKSHIAVVYAGTNPDMRNRSGETANDVLEDIVLFGNGANKDTSRPPAPTRNGANILNPAMDNNQTKDADALAREALKLSGGKQVTFAGHSLGGGLAIYEAVVHRQRARGFSAADPINMLTPQQIEAARKLRKQGLLVDYRNKRDIITGNTNKATSGGPDAVALTIWCADKGELFTKDWDGHGLQYYRFNSNGGIDALAYQPKLYAAINGSLSADYEALESGRQKCLNAIAYLENLKKLNDSVPSRVKEVYADAYSKTSSTIWGLLDERELDGMARERGVYYTQAYDQAAVEESGRKIQTALTQLHEIADTARKAVMEFSGLDSRLATLGASFAPTNSAQESTINQDK